MADDIFFNSEPMFTGGSMPFTPMIDPDTPVSTEPSIPQTGFAGTMLATATGFVPDLVDTVSSSVGLTDRGQINQSMLDAIGSPGIKDFYARHKNAIEIGSGVAAIIAADFGAGKLLKPAGAAMQFTRKLPYVNRISTLDKQYNQAFRIAQMQMLRTARSGAMGIEQYTGAVTAGRLGTTALESTTAGVRNIFTRTAIQKGIARNIATEGILAVGANENAFLFSEDMSENVMWMAGGLAIGATADRLMAVHRLKKFANSDLVSKQFAQAYDPMGTEAARMKAALYQADADADSLSQFGYAQGHWFDAATSYKLSADEGRNVQLLQGGDRNPLAPRRNALAIQQDEEVRNLLNKGTTSGIGGIQGSSFSMNADKMPGFGNHVDYMMHRDAAAMGFVEEIGRVPDGTTSFQIGKDRTAAVETRLAKVTQILDDEGIWVTRKVKDKTTGIEEAKRVLRPLKDEERAAFMAERQLLEWRGNLVEMHAIDGEWVPPEVGHLFDDFKEPNILVEAIDDYRTWTASDREVGDQIGVSSDLEIFTPRSKDRKSSIDPSNLSFTDAISLYRSAQKAIRWFVQNEKRMVVPKNPSWFQLDMAEEFIRKTNNEDLVQFPQGMTRDDARVVSFKQKVRAIRKDKALMGGDMTKAYKARFKYNLPRLNSYEAALLGDEAHPIEVLIRGMGIKDLEDVTYQELVQGIRESRLISGLTESAKERGDSTLGNMFDFMLDDAGEVMNPLVAYKRPTAPFEWTKDDLAERLAMQKMYVRGKLTGQKAAPMTKGITENLLNDPDFVAASQVTGLQDQQLMSMLPGFTTAAPQSTRGGVLNDMTSREWRDRDNPVLLAGARLRDKMERQARAHMEKQITTAMGDVHTRLNGPRNGGSKLLLNQFLTYRQGWDLKTSRKNGKLIVETKIDRAPDGRQLTQYVLDDESLANQQRFKAAYGRDLQEGDVLLNQRGEKIGLDPMGTEFMARFQQLAEDINAEKNTLNAAMGLGNINTIALYAPPPNPRGKYIGFTLDVNNKPVPFGTVIASTQQEFARVRAKLEDPANEFSPLNKPGHRFMTQDEITDFNSVWDEAQMHMIDPGTTAIQPGKRSKGALIGPELNPQAMEDALLWARDAYLKHGNDIMSTVMKDQITALQTRAQIARDAKRNAKSGLTEAKRRSIYDYQLENLLGRSAISSPGSLVGQLSSTAEEWINSALRGGKPAVNRVFRGALDWTRERVPWKNDATSKEAFNNLTNALGEYMPFKSISELMEKQHGAKRPPELAAITGNMSRFEAAMRLRMFEVIHPLMNLSGIVNAMPSVIRAMQPIKGESREDFAARVGHLAKIFDLDDNRRIGVMDMPKLIYQTFKKTWNRERHGDWEYMRSHGYVTQEVAEFHKQFSAIQSREGWKAWALGDPHAKNPVKQKGLVGWVSVLSDRSEDFSRSWGHMLGLELAETLGIAGREAQHSFAHDIANKMIANYDPKNRPAIFQGALGAPIGLFQSFIWNYYQRFFRYIETGDMRALATQYATQSALFGMSTVPGFNVVNKLFFDHSNGENSPVDAIYQRLGEQSGDLVFGGVLSNLPKIVNLLPGEQGVDGMDLYSRGDTNVRLPGFNPPPIIDTMSRVAGAIQQGIGAFSYKNPNFTDNQIAEITSNMLTNRPIAGFVEQFFAEGYDTDRYGQLVAETQGLMEATARVIGIRSLRQSKDLEAFYANNNAKSIQRTLMSELNRSSRASIRAGDAAALPRYFEEYVRRGGDPRRFNTWMKNNAEAAMETRSERMLDDMMKNPAKAQLMERLLDMGVSVNESEALDLNPLDNPYDATDTTTMMETGPTVEPIDGLE